MQLALIRCLYTRRTIYALTLALSLTLCWSDKVSIFFTTFLSSILLIKLLFCIDNSKIRNATIICGCSLSVVIYFIYSKFGGLSTSMIMSMFGVGISLSLGIIKTFGIKFVAIVIAAVLLLSIVTINTPKAKYSRFDKMLLAFTFLFVISKPIFDGANLWGWKFFIKNLQYTPTMISQPYIDEYKILIGPLLSTATILAEDAINSSKYKKVAHKNYPAYIHNDSKPVDNIVYIIGESSNPARYSIYGYSKMTTPHLSQMAKVGKICTVSRVHSPASQTRLAVPMLMSFSTPENVQNLFAYKNLIEMAKINGFQTYWFDSQTQTGLWDKTFGYISQYADVVLTPERNNTAWALREGEDEKLIPAVAHYFQHKQQRNLYVIHIMGSHLPYSARRGSGDNPFTDEYDASIFSTDRFINQIVEQADRSLKNYKLVYVPDHGEVIGAGHGFPTNDNEMYKIPLVTNDKALCDSISPLRHASGYFSSDLTKYLILNMLGFSVDSRKMKHLVNKSDKVLDEKEDLRSFTSLHNS